MELRKKLIAVSAMAFAIALGAGVWGANNVEASAAEQLNGFAITGTAVRLGAGTVADPTGLRFMTVTPEGKAAYENAYTTVTFTSSVEGSEKTYSTDVPATVWRAENDGWNTVLLNIPPSDYQTVITATSYVVKGGVTYEVAEAAVTSIAQTASWAMNQGNTDAALATYTEGAVTEITLDKATASVELGATAQLTATVTPAGYGVVWASDNTDVATVDNTGKVTTLKAGTANITATMSGKTATCAVTVTAPTQTYPTLIDFEDGVDSGLVKGGDNKTTAQGVVDTSDTVPGNGNKALQIKTDSSSIYVAFDKDYVDAAFKDATVTGIQFSVYSHYTVGGETEARHLKSISNHEKPLTYNYVTAKSDGTYGGNSVTLANSLMEWSYDATEQCVVITITRGTYEKLSALYTAGTAVDNPSTTVDESQNYVFIMRLNSTDNNAAQENPKYIYIDDVKPVKAAQ